MAAGPQCRLDSSVNIDGGGGAHTGGREAACSRADCTVPARHSSCPLYVLLWHCRSRQFSGRNSVEDGRLLQAVAAAGPGATVAGGGLLRSATVANPMDVAELLSQTDLQAAIGSVPACALRGAGSAGVGGSGDQAAWVQPSGAPARSSSPPRVPRIPGQATLPTL